MIACKCGCGELIEEYDNWRRKHYYKHGHNSYGRKYSEETKKKITESNKGKHFDRIGKSATWKIKDKVNERTSRERAVKILKREGRYSLCQVNDSFCSKRLEAHHIDKNPFNNDSKNLLCLCTSHHRLSELHLLTVDELKNVKVIVRHGRRYTQFNKGF